MSFALLIQIALYMKFLSATTFLKMKQQVSFYYQYVQNDVFYTEKDTKNTKLEFQNLVYGAYWY